MTDTLEPLMLDLLEWLAGGERGYDEVLDAWRTSCPKLPVWEEVNARGFVTRLLKDDVAVVAITPNGREFLARR